MKRKNFNFVVLTILSLFTLIYFNSCSPSLLNLNKAKLKVVDYYQSGQYDNDLNKIINVAEEELNNVHGSDSSAFIFDIDDTALSTYEINKEMDFGYVPDIWNRWINKANAPAIKEVKNFYDYLINKKIRIIFITGRTISQYDATIENLKNQGYTKFDTVITRSKSECSVNAANYKSQKRTELTQIGYDIIGTIGDQWSDLNGPYHGMQVKLPNYMYYIE